MGLKFSTAVRNKMLSGSITRHAASITATTIAAVDGGSGYDSFTDSGNGFLTAGFAIGDSILVYGFTGGMTSIFGPFPIISVTAGVIEVPNNSLVADAAGESVTLVCLTGGSLKDIFKKGVLKIYTGVRPASADSAFTGTLLCQITVASSPFINGQVDGGLEFGVSSGGVIAKTSAVWSGVNIATGIAGWFRFYTNSVDTGNADTSFIYPRIDGVCGTSAADLNMSSTSLTIGATLTIDSFILTMPEFI